MQHNHYTQFDEPIDRYALDNGHEILYVHRPNCGVAEVALMVPMGASDDIVPGALHFYEHLTQKEGDHLRPRQNLALIKSTHGLINRNAWTNWSTILLAGVTRSAGGHELLKAHLYNLLHPEPTSAKIERERGAILSEFRIAATSIGFDAEVHKTLGVDTARFWPTIGFERTIQEIDTAVIERTRAKIRNQQLIALIIGEIDIATVMQSMESLPPVKEPPKKKRTTDSFRPGEYTIQHSQIESLECTWILPFTEAGIDLDRFGYLASLMGNGTNGLLQKKLRHEQGLVYGVNLVSNSAKWRNIQIRFQGLSDVDARSRAQEIIHRCLTPEVFESHIREHFESEKRVYELYRLQAKTTEHETLDSLASIARNQAYTYPHHDIVMSETTSDDVIELAHKVFVTPKKALMNLEPL